ERQRPSRPARLRPGPTGGGGGVPRGTAGLRGRRGSREVPDDVQPDGLPEEAPPRPGRGRRPLGGRVVERSRPAPPSEADPLLQSTLGWRALEVYRRVVCSSELLSAIHSLLAWPARRLFLSRPAG